MRHLHGYRRLNRSSSHRKSLLRGMLTELIRHERLETTVAKAKTLRPVAEKYITKGKSDTVANRRKAYGYLFDKKMVHKLFAEVGPRYAQRPGGYTRILKTTQRVGDAAPMAIIELVQEELSPKKKSSSRASSAKKAAPKKAATKKEAPAKEESTPVEEVTTTEE